MANELEHLGPPGLTIYAKPLPIVASPWGDDAVAMTETGTTGYYSADVASPANRYAVYQQAGASPAATDVAVGVIAVVVTADLVDAPNSNAVGVIQAGLATSEQVSATDSKQDQLIALFQSGLPDVGPGQQRGARRVVKGDTYSATGRQSLVTKHKNADWPTDLSEWTWAFTASKHPDNENDGDALAGSVDVVTATGDSRGLRINHTKAQTLAAAVGRHLYAVRGTNSGDSSVVWTVEMGVVEVEDAASDE